jgi:chemotaxis protein histidine kinase CheA
MDMDALKALIDSGGVEDDKIVVEDPQGGVQDAEVEEEQEEVSADAEEATEDPKEATPSEPDSEDILLRLEEAEKRFKHFESLASRQANEKGQWMSKAQELERRLEEVARRQRDPDSDNSNDLYRDDVRREPQPRQQQNAPQQDAFLMKLAIEREAAEFRQRHPDAFTETGEISEDVKEALSKSSADATYIMESNDPIQASARTRAALEDAYSIADIQRTVKKRQERERRTADQAKGLKDKKRAASISTSGGEPATPKRRVLDPMTMPLDKLKDLIDGANT